MRYPSRTARATLGAALLCCATFASACGNTADGVKKDTEQLADKTAEATSDAGAAISGGTKTADVKTALLADSTLDAGGINVNTDEGTKTVTLEGTVPSAEHKTRAETIAKENATGYTVVNKLTVKP